SNARPTARRRSRNRASSRKPCANKAGMSSSKAWDNSALALWMASRYLGSMATSPGNGGGGRGGFYLNRRCHDSGRKKSTYQRSLITPVHLLNGLQGSLNLYRIALIGACS